MINRGLEIYRGPGDEKMDIEKLANLQRSQDGKKKSNNLRILRREKENTEIHRLSQHNRFNDWTRPAPSLCKCPDHTRSPSSRSAYLSPK